MTLLPRDLSSAYAPWRSLARRAAGTARNGSRRRKKNPAQGKTDKPVEQEGDKDIKEGVAGARRERQGR